MTRVCKYCPPEKGPQKVRTRTPFTEREMCFLECGHCCIYELNGKDEMSRLIVNKRTCPACGDGYETYFDTALGEVCVDCRKVFEIGDVKDAEAFIQILSEMTPDKKTELKEKALKERPSARSRMLHRVGGTVNHNKDCRCVVCEQGRRSAAPAVDKAKVAEAVRSMMQYGVLAHQMDSITQPTAFVIAKNGLFEVRRTDIADIILQPKEVPGVVEELQAGVKLKLPRVPYDFLTQTVAFFREVQKQSGSEALVQVWWNTQEKRYLLHVPDQSVSGGGVQHRSTFDQDQARTAEGEAIWLHVMDIHSHNTMSAFWSGIDDNDERRAPEGRMFGVIGLVTRTIPDWKWRMRSREGFIDLAVSDIFEVDLSREVNFRVQWATIMGQLGKTDGVNKDGSINLSCKVDPFAQADFPQEWMSRLSGRQHGGATGGGMGFTGGGGAYNRTIPHYIYIQQGGELVEYEIGEGGQKPTGFKLGVGGLEESERRH